MTFVDLQERRGYEVAGQMTAHDASHLSCTSLKSRQQRRISTINPKRCLMIFGIKSTISITFDIDINRNCRSNKLSPPKIGTLVIVDLSLKPSPMLRLS